MSTFVGAFVVAFAVQWKLTLITVCIVPAIIVVTGICVAFDMKSENEMMSIYARADQLAEEVFASIKTVHAFWAYPKLAQKYERIIEDARVIGKKKSPVFAVWFSIEFFCVYAGYGLAFWQGILMYSRGEITQPGSIVTYASFPVLRKDVALTLLALGLSSPSFSRHRL